MRTDGEGSILSRANVDRQLAKREPLDLECITAGAKGHAGVVERCHRTTIQITRSLMTAVAWPMALWSHAWKHALWLYNRLPHPANGQRSPYYERAVPKAARLEPRQNVWMHMPRLRVAPSPS